MPSISILMVGQRMFPINVQDLFDFALMSYKIDGSMYLFLIVDDYIKMKLVYFLKEK